MQEEKRYTLYSNGTRPARQIEDFFKEHKVSYKKIRASQEGRIKVFVDGEAIPYYQKDVPKLKARILEDVSV